ncbi:MAG: TMEM165/GDT1 family protein [Actinobacteria bacterium]|nr:TMEM165/GDT1 family protein [Actinomycetota bacterium]
MTALPLILTVFVACAVEAVEALTIVLASGLTREWRSTFQGTAAALVVLAVVVAAIGPALTLLPLWVLRLVVGALLAIFGVQWLRKAILRAAGYKSLHDEASAYLREVAAAKSAAVTSRRGVRDWYAFTLSFKGVLLEGLEVVFIVLTFGANQHNLDAAVIGAAAAVIVVAATGIAVRAPLAKVPENAMKFAVGIMLTSFGIFWGAEGAGVAWPGNDAALLALVPVVALVSLGYTVLLRQRRPAVPVASVPHTSEEVTSS